MIYIQTNMYIFNRMHLCSKFSNCQVVVILEHGTSKPRGSAYNSNSYKRRFEGTFLASSNSFLNFLNFRTQRAIRIHIGTDINLCCCPPLNPQIVSQKIVVRTSYIFVFKGVVAEYPPHCPWSGDAIFY